jgi:molybdate/tungstate transport system ATP-binding protein
MSDSGLAVEGISLTLGAFGLRAVSLEAAAGSILVLLGPNGAGKSVILETIAGFHRPLRGRVRIGGRDVTRLPPEARQVGYVFQNFALFPHLTVAQNVAFGQRARGTSGTHRGATKRGGARQIDEWLERFGLSRLAGRRPADLSGGEKQRVALARALVTDPALFLFDEPFSALDAATRETLRDEFGDFLREAAVPVVYVTHDYADALALGDRIAIVDGGTIVQAGPAAAVFTAPRTARIARLLGVENVIEAEVRTVGAATATIALGAVRIDALLRARRPQVGEKLAVSIRAEDVSILAGGTLPPQGEIALPGTVTRLVQQGPVMRVNCDCGFPIVAHVAKAQARQLGLAPGSAVVVAVEAQALNLLED